LFDLGAASGLTDGQLLERFATSGSEASELAFATLVERHGPMVLRVCRSIVDDPHEAMDAYQATFLTLVRRGPTLWVRDSLGPWLHRVACRAAGHVRAAASRRRALEQRLAVATANRERPDEFRTRDLAAVLHEELDRLPERFRVPILLCDLEGRTCEETARHLGCPVGTVGSRLARGRQRLRDRLTRLGFAPATGSLGLVLAAEANEARASAPFTEYFVRIGVQVAVDHASAERTSSAVVMLSKTLSRSLVMEKIRSMTVAIATAAGVLFIAGWTYHAIAQPQAPPPNTEPSALRKHLVAAVPSRADEPDPQADRRKDFRLAIVGNMRPLIKDEKGVRFQSREAILYKDGTVKLWLMDTKDSVAAPLRHEGPITDVAFFDSAKLLVTCSDQSVRIWDGLSGQLRKEIAGQLVSPLFFADVGAAMRLVTVDRDGRTITTWDLATVEPVGTFRPDPSPRLVGAGLSPDGKILATIGDDRSVSLWDADTQRGFATLRPPSRIIDRVFVTETKLSPDRPTLQLDARFWELVQPLLPSTPKAEPK
jgi:RNA polymerase sigma factor (sigma-70 family)